MMQLPGQEQGPVIKKPSRKTILLFMLVMLVLLVGAQMYQKYFSTDDQAVRERAYLERQDLPVTQADSLQINALYEKLGRIYTIINTYDFDTLLEFNRVNKAALPADFQPKVMTYELLEFLCDSAAAHARPEEERSVYAKFGNRFSDFEDGIQRSMGTGDFRYNMLARRFNGGLAFDVNYIFKEKYIGVLVTMEMTKPEIYADGSDNFYQGSYHGGILVFDIHTLQNVAYVQFVTGNHDEVKVGPYDDQKQNSILLDDMEDNILTHVNDASISVFGRRLPF
ncbi:MAG TPA: hypothetical protein VK826_20595 [Bacteroidia bacterium]|nr:hypothetical protein [Bacteroidia bacterium]